MQSGILNLLLGIPAGNGAAPGASLLSAGEDGGGTGALFSELLGDSGAQLGQDGGATNLLANTDSGLTGSALLAQEVDINAALAQSQNPQQVLAQLLDQSVTPQQAADLIAKIGPLSSGTGGTQQDLWQQLKSTLTQVAAGSQPQKVSDILQSLPALQDDAASQTVVDDRANANNNGPTPLMQSILAFLQTAFNHSTETAQQPAAAPAAAQIVKPAAASPDSLQAATFRSDGDVDQAPAQAQDDKKERTVIDVVPLAQTVQVPVWVQQVASGQPIHDPAIDAAIAPLRLSGDDALPVVSLPVSGAPQVDDTADGADDAGHLSAAATPVAHGTNESVPAPNATNQSTPGWMAHLPFPLTMTNGDADDAASAGQATTSDANPVIQPVLSNISKVNAKADMVAPTDKGGDETAKTADNNTANTNLLAANEAVAATAARTTQSAAHTAAYNNAASHDSPVDQVHVAIRQASSEGINHITIQLEPQGLGRVEVSMNTGSDGRTHMNFLADKPSTLDALSRGAVNLERSLADTGIKADAGNMQFNLRQQPQPQLMGNGMGGDGSGQSQQSRNAYLQQQSDNSDTPTSITVSPVTTRHYTVNVTNGVDIHA